MNDNLKEFKDTMSSFFGNFKDDEHSKIVIDYIFQLLYGVKKWANYIFISQIETKMELRY